MKDGLSEEFAHNYVGIVSRMAGLPLSDARSENVAQSVLALFPDAERLNRFMEQPDYRDVHPITVSHILGPHGRECP